MRSYTKKWLTVLISLFLLGLANIAYPVVWPNTPGGGRTYPSGIEGDYGPRTVTTGSLFHKGLDFPDDSNVVYNSDIRLARKIIQFLRE